MGIGRRVPVGPQSNIWAYQNSVPPTLRSLSMTTWSFPLSLSLRSGNDVVFRMKRSTQLRRLMIAYCDRKSVEFNRMRFFYHGVRLISSRTPDEYDFWSGDVIWAHPVLRGGGAP